MLSSFNGLRFLPVALLLMRAITKSNRRGDKMLKVGISFLLGNCVEWIVSLSHSLQSIHSQLAAAEDFESTHRRMLGEGFHTDIL